MRTSLRLRCLSGLVALVACACTTMPADGLFAYESEWERVTADAQAADAVPDGGSDAGSDAGVDAGVDATADAMTDVAVEDADTLQDVADAADTPDVADSPDVTDLPDAPPPQDVTGTVGDAEIDSDSLLADDATATADTEIADDVTATGDTEIADDVTATGDTEIADDVTATGDAQVADDVTATDDVLTDAGNDDAQDDAQDEWSDAIGTDTPVADANDVTATEDAGNVDPPVGMALLATGTFMMGSAENEGESSEHPAHEVTLAGFAVDLTEVTVAEYALFVATLPAEQQCTGTNADALSCALPAEASACAWYAPDAGTLPMNCVDWHQASAYCAWIGKRLPTEAEWEYAARSGGQSVQFPWGDAVPTCALVVSSAVEGSGCGVDGALPACALVAGNSAQNLCDLAGNLSEWCADWYDAYAAGSVVSPTGPTASPVGARVVRGGGWQDGAAGLRARARSSAAPGQQSGAIGFRCAK